MFKNLEIDWYADGYHPSYYLDCIAVCIAASAGYYDKENYYYYCFLRAIYNLWGKENKNTTQDILFQLGLGIDSYKPVNFEDFLDYVKSCIDDNSPVIITPQYTSMFYCGTYMLSDTPHSDIKHGIILCGYDSERSLYAIRDPFFLEYLNLENYNKLIKPVMKGAPFFKMHLTDNMLSELWCNSDISETYSIKRNTDTDRCFFDFLNFADKFIKNKKNNFMNLLREHSSLIDEYQASQPLRQLVYASQIIFDMMNKYVDINACDKETKTLFMVLNSEYSSSLKKMLYNLQYCAIKRECLDYEKSNKITEEINQLDSKLIELIKRLIKDYKRLCL